MEIGALEKGQVVVGKDGKERIIVNIRKLEADNDCFDYYTYKNGKPFGKISSFTSRRMPRWAK